MYWRLFISILHTAHLKVHTHIRYEGLRGYAIVLRRTTCVRIRTFRLTIITLYGLRSPWILKIRIYFSSGLNLTRCEICTSLTTHRSAYSFLGLLCFRLSIQIKKVQVYNNVYFFVRIEDLSGCELSRLSTETLCRDNANSPKTIVGDWEHRQWVRQTSVVLFHDWLYSNKRTNTMKF